MLRTSTHILSRIRPTYLECVSAETGEPVNLPLSSFKDFYPSNRPVTASLQTFLLRPREFFAQLRLARNQITFSKPTRLKKVSSPKPPRLNRRKATIAIEQNISLLTPMQRAVVESVLKQKKGK